MPGDLTLYSPKLSTRLQVKAYEVMIKELQDKIAKLELEKQKILTTQVMKLDLEIESDKEHIEYIRSQIKSLDNVIDVEAKVN